MATSKKKQRLDGGGLRHNSGKLRIDLIPADFVRGLAGVLTHACTARTPPYPERNWERGMKWSQVIGSLERHLNDLKMGIRLDPSGSGLRSAMLLACNAMFVATYDVRGMYELDDLEPFARASNSTNWFLLPEKNKNGDKHGKGNKRRSV